MEKLCSFLFSLLAFPLLFAQNGSFQKTVVVLPDSAFCALQADIERILDHPDVQSLFLGVHIESLKTGELLYSLNSKKLFLPASLTKLFTTATALDFLGQDYRFRTVVFTDGFISKDSVLRGNIILWSNGNPALSEEYGVSCDSVLAFLAAQLVQKGIHSIEGDLVVDDSYFDRVYWGEGWSIDDLGYAYGAPVSALSTYGNCIRLLIIPPRDTITEPYLFQYPAYPMVSIQSQLQLIDSGQTSIQVEREPCNTTYVLHGVYSMDSLQLDTLSFALPVDDPAYFAGYVFRQFLQERGITIRGSIRKIDDFSVFPSQLNWFTLVEWQSPPLEHLIACINQQSLNLGAEMLLKALGKIFRTAGSWDAGIDAVLSFLRYIGIDIESLRLVDGSGLSRMNLVAPSAVIQLLRYMYRSKHRTVFLSSLAQPGKKGTLQNRMSHSRAVHRIFAKTGSLRGVSNIAGYAFSEDGEPFAFAIFMNNSTIAANQMRNIQDLLLLRLVNFTRKIHAGKR